MCSKIFWALGLLLISFKLLAVSYVPQYFVGNWLNQQTDYIELLQINEDSTYLQLGLDLQQPENSFAEWGSYTLSKSSHFSELPLIISFNPTFSNNPAKGLMTLLSDRNKSHVYISSSSERLQLNMDYLSDNAIDVIVEYHLLQSQDIEGYWYNHELDDLFAVLMLNNGLYVQLQINLDHDDETTGMEWGQYQHQIDSGEVYFQAEYDDNQQTGFNRLDDIAAAAFKIKLHDNQLIFLLDSNDDGIIDSCSALLRKN
ncbi:hypothetical protein [Shewanella sp. UCD-KL21]|uniref:hypothetical protein n=1 Tax=Shewanella sp. UCD-KL21 TaxID=1917164 RepID=UPI0009708B6D|nr:hypothetical protein [Shewanella sp. UCD-KL21]